MPTGEISLNRNLEFDDFIYISFNKFKIIRTMSKTKKWFKPMFDDEPVTGKTNGTITPVNSTPEPLNKDNEEHKPFIHNSNVNSKSWLKNFDPITVEDLAVHHKKVQDLDQWLGTMCKGSCGEILLLSGPVGCGKTATVTVLAQKHKVKVTEWITPLDIDIPTDYGDFEYREKQSTKFLEFVINAANFTSLLDNNSKKLVLIEDMPNIFIRTPSEFTTVLQQYKNRAKSPIIFICSDSHTDNKNSALNLFTKTLKEQFNIQHITFNGVAPTGLKSALKRVSDIISKKFISLYTTPSPELIECVANSSIGDVRSAVLNLHFACLRGSKHNLDVSITQKEQKTKTVRKKKQSSKFNSIGKDDTVSILHGVGRVLNPKKTENGNLTNNPGEVTDQFVGQAGSFVNFLHENYLPHFSSIEDAQQAASELSNADFLLAEWREQFSQDFGLYVAVAGLMLANKNPVSAWNPVRGPKNMRIKYPSTTEIPLLDPDVLYKGKILVSDYQTYCKIIGGQQKNISINHNVSFNGYLE